MTDIAHFPGEQPTWDQLETLDPQSVVQRTDTVYNADRAEYTVKSFGQNMYVSSKTRHITTDSDIGNTLLNTIGSVTRVSILRYLADAKNIPETGELLKPADLPGGDIFRKGTHVLPLDSLAQIFGNGPEALMSKGASLGNTEYDTYGDYGLKVYPLPRIPVIVIIWKGDNEFPPKASLLFDSSCSLHLATDVLWSVATMTCRLLLSS